jgi:hypothetical protein
VVEYVTDIVRLADVTERAANEKRWSIFLRLAATSQEGEDLDKTLPEVVVRETGHQTTPEAVLALTRAEILRWQAVGLSMEEIMEECEDIISSSLHESNGGGEAAAAATVVQLSEYEQNPEDLEAMRAACHLAIQRFGEKPCGSEYITRALVTAYDLLYRLDFHTVEFLEASE